MDVPTVAALFATGVEGIIPPKMFRGGLSKDYLGAFTLQCSYGYTYRLEVENLKGLYGEGAVNEWTEWWEKHEGGSGGYNERDIRKYFEDGIEDMFQGCYITVPSAL